MIILFRGVLRVGWRAHTDVYKIILLFSCRDGAARGKRIKITHAASGSARGAQTLRRARAVSAGDNRFISLAAYNQVSRRRTHTFSSATQAPTLSRYTSMKDIA
jgi:hypothetical protein